MSSDITCRGSYALGTACGKCRRCEEERAQMLSAPSPCSAPELKQNRAGRVRSSEIVQRTVVTIESTTNGIWIRMGKESRMLWTTEASKLVDHLNEALQHCGKWTLSPPNKVSEVAGRKEKDESKSAD